MNVGFTHGRGAGVRFTHLLLAVTLCLPLAEGKAAGDHDLRVVIDISGSMKQTDPGNLRIPALQLLTELLPSGMEAGVWTFGQWVNMLVAHGEVTPLWKDRARAEARKINSVALFTDIGQALQRATRDWDSGAAGQRRSLILLTDGKVDVDKSPQINARARSQVLDERLPALIEAGVSLYPVGLSDDVDHELLEVLARETGGLYQIAHTAEDLQRIFLRILEQSTQANTLPIVDGGFQVDAAIEEINIVVFRNDGGGRIALRDPAGTEMRQDARPGSVRWFEEGHYAAITVPDPAGGRWQILTDPHPDNRVFIVSRLQLVPDPVPVSLFAGEEIALRTRLMDGEAPIEDAGFLQLLNTQAVIEHEQESPTVWPLEAGTEPGSYRGSGRFTTQPGPSSVSFVAEGPTFHRSVRRIVTLRPDPLSARWEGPSWVGKAGYLALRSSAAGLASDELTISVQWNGPGVTRRSAQTRLPTGESRTLPFVLDQAGVHQAQVAVTAIADDGRSILIHLPSITVQAQAEPPRSPQPEPPAAAASAPPPQPAPLIPHSLDTRGWLVFGAGNLLLALAALYHALRTRRRDSAAMEQRLAKLDAEATTAPTSS